MSSEVVPEEIGIKEFDDNGNENEDAEMEEANRLKQVYAKAAPGGSFRALASSAWVVDLEREQEGYTAGRWTTIGAMCSACFMILGATAAYILIFCSIQLSDDQDQRVGFGDDVFKQLIEVGESDFAFSFAVGTVVFLGAIYIFDVWNWKDAGKIMGILSNLILLTAVVLLFVTSLVLTAQLVALPFVTFWVTTLSAAAALKTFVFPTVQKLFFLRSLQLTLFFCSVAVAIFYAVSVFGQEQYYGAEVQVFYSAALDCDPIDAGNGAFIEYQTLLDDPIALEAFLNSSIPFSECDEAFIVWAAPGFFFMVGFLLAGVMFFLYRAEKRRIESHSAVGIEPLAQIFLTTMLLSLFGLWVSASIASATASVGDAILSISFLTLMLMISTSVAVFGLKYLESQIKKTAIGTKAFEFFSSNWGKGLLIVTSSPILIGFFAVDYIKQKVRTKTMLGKRVVDEEEKKMMFTKSVSKALENAKHWEWGSVITVALVWGIIFFIISVGVARLIIVFLSFLRDAMSDLTLLEATGVLIGVGLFLFLLPPVPGVPVYVTAGVVLPTIAEGEGIGLAAAIAYGTMIGVFLKLTALVLQQKVIGEGCASKSVSIRAAVGINSIELRAMKRVLSEGTFNWKKVAILCGGPDWPTSVLTGIMKLSVFKMLLGTTPIVFLIAPCVISGAMLVKASEDPEDEFFTSINTVALFLTVVVQSASMLAAAHVLATAAVKYKDELANDELDQEVLQLEIRTRAKKLNYKAVTAWVNLSTFWRFTHILNLVLMILSCYAFQFAGSTLFEEFEITDSIADDLGGNFLHIVTLEGWGVVTLFLIATTYYFLFKNVHKRKIASDIHYERAGIDREEEEKNEQPKEDDINPAKPDEML